MPESSSANMSNNHHISSSLTNLTSVSSVSSTSLASSTGANVKKRRAPKPPASGVLNPPPTHIEEEAVDSETSTLRSGTNESNASKTREPVLHHGVQEEIHRNSRNTVSSLSSPINSNSHSPVPPQVVEASSSTTSTKSEGPLLTSQYSGDLSEGRRMRDDDASVEDFDESGSRSMSRSSSTPCNDTSVAPPSPPPQSVSLRSRKLSSNNAVEVEETVTSSRPPSSNTQGKPLKLLAHFQAGHASNQERGEKWENFLRNLESILQKRAELV